MDRPPPPLLLSFVDTLWMEHLQFDSLDPSLDLNAPIQLGSSRAGQQGCAWIARPCGCCHYCHSSGLWDSPSFDASNGKCCLVQCGFGSPRVSQALSGTKQSSHVCRCIPHKEWSGASTSGCEKSCPPPFARRCDWEGKRKSHGYRSSRPWCCYRAKRRYRSQ